MIGLVGLVFRLHYNGGNRWNHYGPTLKNLLSVAREAEEISPNAVIESDTFHLSQFPLMMESLRIIIRPTVASPQSQDRVKLFIRYEEPDNLVSGRVILIRE